MPTTTDFEPGFSATRTKSGSDDGNFVPGSSTWRMPLTTTIVADWTLAAPPVENVFGFSSLAPAPLAGASVAGPPADGTPVFTCWTKGSFGRKTENELSFAVLATDAEAA